MVRTVDNSTCIGILKSPTTPKSHPKRVRFDVPIEAEAARVLTATELKRNASARARRRQRHSSSRRGLIDPEYIALQNASLVVPDITEASPFGDSRKRPALTPLCSRAKRLQILASAMRSNNNDNPVQATFPHQLQFSSIPDEAITPVEYDNDRNQQLKPEESATSSFRPVFNADTLRLSSFLGHDSPIRRLSLRQTLACFDNKFPSLAKQHHQDYYHRQRQPQQQQSQRQPDRQQDYYPQQQDHQQQQHHDHSHHLHEQRTSSVANNCHHEPCFGGIPAMFSNTPISGGNSIDHESGSCHSCFALDPTSTGADVSKDRPSLCSALTACEKKFSGTTIDSTMAHTELTSPVKIHLLPVPKNTTLAKPVMTQIDPVSTSSPMLMESKSITIATPTGIMTSPPFMTQAETMTNPAMNPIITQAGTTSQTINVRDHDCYVQTMMKDIVNETQIEKTIVVDGTSQTNIVNVNSQTTPQSGTMRTTLSQIIISPVHHRDVQIMSKNFADFFAFAWRSLSRLCSWWFTR